MYWLQRDSALNNSTQRELRVFQFSSTLQKKKKGNAWKLKDETLSIANKPHSILDVFMWTDDVMYWLPSKGVRETQRPSSSALYAVIALYNAAWTWLDKAAL